MASPSQILANRENAQRSTGPKTGDGKQTASRNALRHGLTGTQIVIPGEDPTAYEDLRQGLLESHRPANEAERILVDQIAANAWRLLRAQRVETAFLAKLTEGAEDPDAAIAEAFLEKPKELARMHRYVAAAQNAYYKALSQLAKLQKERATTQEEEIGFVSYPPSIAFLGGPTTGYPDIASASNPRNDPAQPWSISGFAEPETNPRTACSA
jgi:hypothetical protein